MNTLESYRQIGRRRVDGYRGSNEAPEMCTEALEEPGGREIERRNGAIRLKEG